MKGINAKWMTRRNGVRVASYFRRHLRVVEDPGCGWQFQVFAVRRDEPAEVISATYAFPTAAAAMMAAEIQARLSRKTKV